VWDAHAVAVLAVPRSSSMGQRHHQNAADLQRHIATALRVARKYWRQAW
jgi:hypothetical protein